LNYSPKESQLSVGKHQQITNFKQLAAQLNQRHARVIERF